MRESGFDKNLEKATDHGSSSILSPEGRCEAYPVGVQLFLLMFPPKEDTQYLTRGPNVFTCDLFGLGNL